MKDPILSIGIIFKNDIRCIERCLKSLEPLRKAVPSELVMADTGSIDGSRAVAERYADILIDFPWVNDFAAARNAVLDRCTGDWCLTVDTDEWLDSAIGEVESFLESGEREKFDVGSLILRNYYNKQLRDYGDFFAMRLAQRCGGQLRYTGAIHEVFSFPQGTRPRHIVLSRTIFHHDGYAEMTPGYMRDKHRRNMGLLQDELKRAPEDLRILGYCMESAETPEEKLDYAERAYTILRGTRGKYRVGNILAYQKCIRTFYNS